MKAVDEPDETSYDRPKMNDSDPPPAQTSGASANGGLHRDLQLQNPNRYPEAGARRLRPWLEPVLDALAPEAKSFAVRWISDREMRRLNRQYRGKDKTTDVLSFPGDLVADEAPEASPLPRLDHLGDVVISVPTARRQAEQAGQPVDRELRVLLLHGVLHCLGYDHETDDGTMERLEMRLRRRFIDHA